MPLSGFGPPTRRSRAIRSPTLRVVLPSQSSITRSEVDGNEGRDRAGRNRTPGRGKGHDWER
eukprot:7576217-Alexandrium_andersonii.AAC.1